MGRESNQGDSSYFNPWSTAVTIFTGGENISDEGYVDNGRGYKVAFITELFELNFRGLAFGEYTVSSKAKCLRNRKKCEAAVNLNCECGFYAFYNKNMALEFVDERRGLYLLEVEFYGKIIEHSDGLKGSEQDVIRVFIPNKCTKSLCKRDAIFFTKHKTIFGKKIYKVSCDVHQNETSYEISSLKNNDIDIVRM
jgi:hypothetical protein